MPELQAARCDVQSTGGIWAREKFLTDQNKPHFICVPSARLEINFLAHWSRQQVNLNLGTARNLVHLKSLMVCRRVHTDNLIGFEQLKKIRMFIAS